MNDLSNMISHFTKIEDVTSSLETDMITGLSDEQVTDRLKQYGSNSLTEKKRISPIVIFLNQFKSPIVIILFIAAGLSCK